MKQELKAMGCPAAHIEQAANMGAEANAKLGIDPAGWIALVQKFMANLPVFLAIVQAILDALPKKPV